MESSEQGVKMMPFMCLTCNDRPEFKSGEGAVDHMTGNPFHQMVYYDIRSVDAALDKVKEKIGEKEI